MERLSSVRTVGKSFDVGAKGVVLHFEKGESVKAAALILAMPRRSLELLAANTSFLQDNAVTRLIKSVTPRPLFKLFMSWEVKEQITHPVKGAPVYICGEAYSNAQGWVRERSKPQTSCWRIKTTSASRRSPA